MTGQCLADEQLQEARRIFAERGLVLVPREPTEQMLSVRDEDGDQIWGGGVEHWFRNKEEAWWYGRQVWLAMVSAAEGSVS